MKTECDTKQKLLDTAMQLIWEQSYGAVSVDHICERASAKKGSFYHFFPSKSDLAVAAIDDHWRKLRPDLDRIFSPQAPPLERLAGYCDFVYEQQRQQMQRFGRVCGCAFTSLGSELSTQDEKIRKKSLQIMEWRCKYLAAAIRDAVREGAGSGTGLRRQSPRPVWERPGRALAGKNRKQSGDHPPLEADDLSADRRARKGSRGHAKPSAIILDQAVNTMNMNDTRSRLRRTPCGSSS